MKKHFKKSLLIVLLVAALLILAVPVASASGGNYHRVSYGETLFSIGRMYGVNPYYIADVNNIANPNCIYAGQVLYIPTDYYNDGGCKDCYNPCGDGQRHVVVYGETLTNIAYRYGVSAWAIANTNHIYNMNCIYAGQVLIIPTAGNCY
jgi:LysM repeat protein